MRTLFVFLRVTFIRIALGLRDLPGYGSHPGTAPLVLMCFLGACASGSRGRPIYEGFLFMLLTVGPIYLSGAWSRGKSYLLNKEGSR